MNDYSMEVAKNNSLSIGQSPSRNRMFGDLFSASSLFPFSLTLLFIAFSYLNLQFIAWIILGVGFLTVGLPHGALDHLVDKNLSNKLQLSIFILNYLLKSVLLGIIWFFAPDLALIIFIFYSAWHFGEGDFSEWKIKDVASSWMWGMILLLSILILHSEEVLSILKQVHANHIANYWYAINDQMILMIQVILICTALLITYRVKNYSPLVTLGYIVLSAYLPLLLSFGIYFIAQHSLFGWRHLKIGLQQSSFSLWKKTLPFTIAGASIIVFFMMIFNEYYLGMFFISLSCLSIPHVFSMHNFYVNYNKASVTA